MSNTKNTRVDTELTEYLQRYIDEFERSHGIRISQRKASKMLAFHLQGIDIDVKKSKGKIQFEKKYIK